jgi:hypothetical protein
LARCIHRVRATALQPERRPISDTVCHDRAGAAAAELEEVAQLLRQPGPIAARGAALVSVLLTDGWGPLFNRANHSDLRGQLRTVLAALDVLDSW